jgi:hypothetical protein
LITSFMAEEGGRAPATSFARVDPDADADRPLGVF